MDPISKAFVARIEEFVRKNQVPVVAFKKGQRKDDVAREQRSRFEGDEGVVFVGKAQEKTPVFRTERRRDETGRPYPWIVRSTAMVSTTSTSTAWTGTSVPSSSSSAPTSPTPPSCVSTATST